MATVNVNRNNPDVFYRYKMPLLQAKVEGTGNGVKTVLPNMMEVARALARPPSYPTKYFGCELGAQVQMDEKNERYIVNGCHDAAKLQNLLDNFIKTYVLCQSCDNPETTLTVKKGAIKQTCAACGHSQNINSTHKLNTYILNHPHNVPASSSSVNKTKKDKTEKPEKTEKSGKSGKSKEEPTSPSDKGGEEEDSDLATPVTAGSANGDDDNWSDDDFSEEAVKQRQQALSGNITTLTMNDALEKPEKERFNMFFEYVKAKTKCEKFPAKEVLLEAKRLDIIEKGIVAIVELLLDSNDIIKLIDQHKALLQNFCVDAPKAQKSLLGAIEAVIAGKKDLLGKIPRILKVLYDCDIVDEEVFVAWADKSSKKYVSKEMNDEIRAKAEPFIKWLKEAEEEDSEDEVEVDFNSAARKTGIVATEPVKPAAVTAEADEDDVDIDAI